MRDVLDAQPIRDDRRESVEAVASVVMYGADWDTLASRPTWAELIKRCREMTGRGSRATIARHLAYLIALNLITRAASGRRGCTAPGGCQATVTHWKGAGPCLSPGDCPPDEAAVYVLCIPAPIRAVEEPENDPDTLVQDAEALAPVDELETPPTTLVDISLPVRARQTENSNHEPLRGTAVQAAQAPHGPSSTVDRQLTTWLGSATTSSPDDRLAAALELQYRLPVLRQISAKDLRSCLRQFFLAGWTVSDIHRALDWRPDGTRWPHSGATGISAITVPGQRRAAPVRGWIAYRLEPWTSNETPLPSPSQRRAAEVDSRLERQRRRRRCARPTLRG